MKLHNTLTRKVEQLEPINKDEVKLYTCGPTVYDYPQLGNLRSFIFDDTLRRALESNGFDVKHVMNITDVGHLSSDMDEGEDKLEKGAAREGKDVWEVAQHYIDSFVGDMAELNVLPPNGYHSGSFPYARATEFIEQQKDLVKLLLEKGFAYQTEQTIYFDVSKLPDYGKLAGQKLADKEVGARAEVVTDSSKRHPQDFAVWFFTVGRFANHTMRWPSPWGDGFPGWHLECSAIIHSTLGEPIDIHTGGVDHIGTHHTNEIAQTEAAYGKKLANFWVHNEFLLIDGQRMGKSLGNFFTLSDVKKRGFDPLALRLLFLQSHYRSQMNFTWESLEAAQNFLKRLEAWADLRFQPSAFLSEDNEVNYDSVLQTMREAISNDLNSAEALGALSELVTESEEKGVSSAQFPNLLTELDKLLGLGLSKRKDIDEDQKTLLSQRQSARDNQDWGLSDKTRDELEAKKITVKDTAHGQIWQRI